MIDHIDGNRYNLVFSASSFSASPYRQIDTRPANLVGRPGVIRTTSSTNMKGQKSIRTFTYKMRVRKSTYKGMRNAAEQLRSIGSSEVRDS